MLKEKMNLYQYRFLRQFFDLNPEIHAIHEHLERYVKNNFTGRECHSYYGTLKHSYERLMDSMFEFEVFISTDKDVADIKEKALSSFENKDVRTVKSVDMIEIKRMEMLVEYGKDLYHILNAVDGMDEHNRHVISSQVKEQLMEILANKGLDKFEIEEELLINNQNQ